MHSSWRRINALDLDLCLRFNRLAHIRFWRSMFRAISRLGDGVFWYGLMATLLFANGTDALPTVLRMALAGLLGLLIYKWLKTRTSRPRPCEVYAAITAEAPALDRFSFPSGHTLHAVTFSIVACAGYPELSLLLFPFAVLVAISRPVLGLHYPSDVLAGAFMGAIVARLVLLV